VRVSLGVKSRSWEGSAVILVLGAGGQVGSALLAALRATGQQTRAVYHSPAKAAQARADGHEAVTADLSEPGTLPAAFAGGRALLLLGAMSPQQTAHELNAVRAAAAAVTAQVRDRGGVPRRGRGQCGRLAAC
jgi:uncharacterized protein YbjT (DUF2867 family)